jgi:hypothetical protein
VGWPIDLSAAGPLVFRALEGTSLPPFHRSLANNNTSIVHISRTRLTSPARIPGLRFLSPSAAAGRNCLLASLRFTHWAAGMQAPLHDLRNVAPARRQSPRSRRAEAQRVTVRSIYRHGHVGSHGSAGVTRDRDLSAVNTTY